MEPNTTSSSDEIELGQLLQLVRKGLNGIFRGILRVFRYLKRNMIKLLAVTIVGVAIGFLLNSFVDDRLQTEAIVKPNFESKDYLYDVVEELQASIMAKDTSFFKNLGIDVNQLRKFRIDIEPIGDEIEVDKEMAEEDNKYLEILQNFEDNDFVFDIVKSEILKKSIRTHRITFTHKNAKKGGEYVAKILNYINSNPYFEELQKTYSRNAALRIEENQGLIKQIDELVSNFSEGLKNIQNPIGQGTVVLEGENGLNMPTLLLFKSRLAKENEVKQVELIEQKTAVSILNLGKTHVVKKPFFNKNIVLIPILLLSLFFMISLISYMNRKSIEIQ